MAMTLDVPPLRFSHVGMFVRDVERMAAFYKEVLAFVETDRGPTRGYYVVFLTRHPHAHHQLVLSSGRPDSSGHTHAIQQLSFMADDLEGLRRMQRIVSARSDVSDIAPRDHGNAWSLYFRDPEENRIEVYLDTPWHIAQPHHVVLDLALSDEEIHRRTEARVRADPSFKPMPERHREQAEMLRAMGTAVRA
ncbi:MAG: VOC family protein [Burkholderiales bacterium]|nr:VOC family protein [Burkholderiales bacterium]